MLARQMGATENYDAIVLGAGGAGLMCAAVAGQRGRRVLLIDHAPEPGRKILISGGGRCNFTNLHTAPECYLCANEHFAKSALGRYLPEHYIALVDRYGIAWHEKTLGQLFCDGSARQIVAMLVNECTEAQVALVCGQDIAEVTRRDDKYQVRYGSHSACAPSLVVATGGPSIPKLGATGFAYDLARQFGLKVVEPRPALVPLSLGPEETLFKSLSGVATDVVAHCGARSFREAALFTHKGMSGPAILQISSYWRHGQGIEIDFLPDQPENWLLSAKQTAPQSLLRAQINAHLPTRLADALAARIALTDDLANTPDRVLRSVQQRLMRWPFMPSGTGGFAKAEVTVGGIDTAALSSKTMQSRRVPGLYAIGEAVDVTGWLGGYNFQWAWASGWAAGQNL